MTGMLQRIARGERPTAEGADYSDTDAWNAKFALAAKPQNANTVVADWRQTHGNFVRAAKTVPDDRFGEKDGKPKTASRLLEGGGHGHFKEHAEQILAWRKQEGV